VKSLLRSGALLLVLLAIAAPSFAATFVYVHSRGTGEVFGFELAKDGTLTALPGSPFATGGGFAGADCGGPCQTMAYSKRGKALIAGEMDSISSLVVAKDGTLSPAPGSPLAMTGVFLGTGVAQNGKYVYVNDYDGDVVHGFAVGKMGDLSAIAGSPWTTGGDRPIGLSAGKEIVISANQFSSDLSGPSSLASFRVGEGGVLTPAPNSPVTSGDVVESVDVDTRGRFAYAGDCGFAGIHGFAIDGITAEIFPLAGSPFATASVVCNGVAPTRKGAIAFTRFSGFQVFSRGKDGALVTPAAPVATDFRDSHALTRNEKIIVAAEDSTGMVGTFAFDRKTGSITPIDSDSIAGASMAQATVIVKR
jgi:hypothetical protein